MTRRSPLLLSEPPIGIYCRGDSSRSEGCGHVFPEALARNTMTLPHGVECDACNRANGKLDAVLQNHNRIGTVIIHHGIAGKNGPRRRIGILERDSATGDVRVHAKAESAHCGDNHLEIQLPDIARLDEARFRRALHHIGFNHLALISGAATCLDPRFDDMRQYIRYGSGKPRSYAQFMRPDDEIREPLGCSYFRWEAGTIIQIRRFIDDFYVDLSGGDLRAFATRVLPRAAAVL